MKTRFSVLMAFFLALLSILTAFPGDVSALAAPASIELDVSRLPGLDAPVAKATASLKKITPSPKKISAIQGQTISVRLKLSPYNPDDLSIKYTTKVLSFVSLEEDPAKNAVIVTYKVKGKNKDKAKIQYASKTKKKVKGSIAVTVKPTPVSSVSLNQSSATLKPKDTLKLSATVLPADATSKAVTWKSSDKKVVTVSKNGAVTAKAPGKATITVQTKSGKKKASCVVTVQSVPVTAVSLNKLEVGLKYKKSVTLKATVSPSNATTKTIKWASSDTKVATVSKKGKVTAKKKAGIALITAKSSNGIVAQCYVHVSKNGKIATSMLTPVSTPKPTVKPTLTPTVKPMATATVKPTLTPTVKPIATATVKPTLTPTVKPTPAPTVKPTPSPTSMAIPMAIPTSTTDELRNAAISKVNAKRKSLSLPLLSLDKELSLDIVYNLETHFTIEKTMTAEAFADYIAGISYLYQSYARINILFASSGTNTYKCTVVLSELPSDDEIKTMPDEVIRIINVERAKENLAPLRQDDELTRAAKVRSEETTRLFAHLRPDGSDISGVSPLLMGENIAYGQINAEAVMIAWMNSPGHRANILTAEFTTVGVDAYRYNGQLYWVQLFGTH